MKPFPAFKRAINHHKDIMVIAGFISSRTGKVNKEYHSPHILSSIPQVEDKRNLKEKCQKYSIPVIDNEN
jgi:hypothetical protein